MTPEEAFLHGAKLMRDACVRQHLLIAKAIEMSIKDASKNEVIKGRLQAYNDHIRFAQYMREIPLPKFFEDTEMSSLCRECGAAAGWGHELGHSINCSQRRGLIKNKPIA